MKNKSSLFIALLASSVFTIDNLSAASLLTYDMGTTTFTTFTGTASGTALPTANGTASSVASGITAGTLMAGTISVGSSGLGNPVRSLFFTEGASGGDFNATNETGAVTGTDYLQFTITPSSGFKATFSSIAFDFTRGGSGAFTNWFLRTNAASDNYATTVASGSFGTFTDSVFRNTSSSISDSNLIDTDTATTFRLYAYGATAAASKRIDQIVLSGTITAVPEPSTYIGGGLILGLAAWSQRKRFAMSVSA